MEGVFRLKIGGARHPTDILECALEYKMVGNPWFKGITSKDIQVSFLYHKLIKIYIILINTYCTL